MHFSYPGLLAILAKSVANIFNTDTFGNTFSVTDQRDIMINVNNTNKSANLVPNDIYLHFSPKQTNNINSMHESKRILCMVNNAGIKKCNTNMSTSLTLQRLKLNMHVYLHVSVLKQ